MKFRTASSAQIEKALCERVGRIRLARNITQAQLAAEAGVSTGTIRRMENGAGVSLDTFIRVLMALDVQQNLETLLPDPSVRPMERIMHGGRERKRARPSSAAKEPSTWSWGDEGERDG
ncbi:MAG: helix-turn-helix transcriptional regulator [Bacteroidota bacterium]